MSDFYFHPFIAASLGAILCYVALLIKSRFFKNGNRHAEIEKLTEDCNKILMEQEILKGQYNLLTENLAASVVIRNAQGKISYCSPYTEVLTGHALTNIYESENDFFLEVAHDDDKDNIHRALKISAVGEAFQFRFRFYHKTGILMWAETRTVPIIGKDGIVSSSLSITLDVTGNVLYQKQVEEKNKDLQDFTYMVSHDLKAPIFTIKGMVGILNEEPIVVSSEEVKEPIVHISKAANRLEQLVSSVLEYSKISAQEFDHEAVQTSAVIQEVIEEMGPQIKAANAEVALQENLPEILCNKLRLYQIFANLLGNSLKYRDQKRTPQVTIKEEPSKNRRYVTLTISDNCIGIPADKINSIFRPFQRAHSSDIEGSGIGLACVKKFVEKSHGQISVESEVGKGSTFRLTFRRKIGE